MEDIVVNTLLIMELHMINEFVNNNYRSEGFGKHGFDNELLGVLVESTEIFTQSLSVFTKTSNLVFESTEEIVQFANVLP
jgi:uncharacterized protein YozE (UPF0346 family)